MGGVDSLRGLMNSVKENDMEPIMLGVIILMLGFIYKDLEEIKILIKYNHNAPIEDEKD